MSYASGMAIGLTIGQQILSLFSQDKTANSGFNFQMFNQELDNIEEKIKENSFRLAHAIKGRRRYYIDSLKKNDKLAKLLSIKLMQLPYVKEVATNINTGSLLIIYNCAENIIDDIFTQLKEKVFNITRSIVDTTNKAATMAGSAIVAVVNDINDWIKRKTNNVLDLRVLISSLFIVRGIRKVLTMGQRPNGPQMLWWAFSILRGLGK